MKTLKMSPHRMERRNVSLASAAIAMGNSFSPGGDLTGAGNGTICLANDSLLRQTEYIEELTSFAISYDGMKGNGLARLRDSFAPPRPSNSRIVRLTTYDENEPWQTVNYNAVKRGILADFLEVPQRIATKNDLEVNNRGLSVVLDRDQLKDKPEWQQVHTKWLIDLLNMASVLEAVSLLGAAATQANLTWDSASNPDLDIKNNIITQANITGFYPNTAAYGDLAALIRSNAYESQLTAGSIARAAKLTEAEIATSIGVDNCIINAERYQVANGTTKQEIIGSNVLLYTSLPESPMDATNLVRHVANAAYGGGDYAVYVTELGIKKVVLTVENFEYLHMQHTTGLMQLAVAA